MADVITTQDDAVERPAPPSPMAPETERKLIHFSLNGDDEHVATINGAIDTYENGLSELILSDIITFQKRLDANGTVTATMKRAFLSPYILRTVILQRCNVSWYTLVVDPALAAKYEEVFPAPETPKPDAAAASDIVPPVKTA